MEAQLSYQDTEKIRKMRGTLLSLIERGSNEVRETK